MSSSEYGSLMLEEEEVEEDASFVEKLLANKAVRITMFVIMICYGLLGVVFDWLWVADTLSVEKALVFGPPGTDIVVTLIVVASIGTISFALEITNVVMKECCGKPLMPEQFCELLTLCVEEVPQITLSVMLASCREVPMSYYQMIKAALAMFGAIYRSIRVLGRYFTVRRRGEKTGFWRFLVRTLILAACVYILIASILVWVFTYSDNTPENVYSKTYNDARYLYLSAVYFSHPFLALCNNNTLPWNETQHNWVQMEGIYDIRDTEECQFNFHYNDSHAVTHIHSIFKDHTSEVCYLTTRPDCATNTVKTSCEHLNYQSSISIKLGEKGSSKTRVFGDITYKAVVRENGTCDELYSDHVGFFRKENDDRIHGQFQYFKVYDHVNDTTPFYWSGSGEFRPYVYQHDTQNVTDVWLTGYNECEMTGSLVPNRDKKLDLHC